MRSTNTIAGRSTVLASLASLTALAALTVAPGALAAPALRLQVNQHGDFLLIGNTIGYDCDTGTPLPVAPSVLAADACAGTNVGSATDLNDSSPDVYWEADDPTAGVCTADSNTTAAGARSSAILTVPVGATVTSAFLYWSATNSTAVAGTTVKLDRPGAGGFGAQTITAIQSWLETADTDNAYQSVADITALVQANGSGSYRVGGIDVAPFVKVDKDVLYGGWWIVAFYQLPTDPLRNLALFDGLDVVKSGMNQSITLTGFLVPAAAGFDGKLGVVAFEGDNQGTGDSLFFNNVQLSNTQNPINNFFNSTRSWLGAPVSVVGDQPQLTGTPQSMAGVDIDVVDISADLTMGQKSAPIQATTTGDTYYLGGFVTSISTFAPDFSTSTKTAKDVNGGLLVPGDVVTYTISATNVGNDTSVGTIVTDPLPTQVTYVPGSITIDGVAKTDATGDDQAEYVAGTRTVTARLGMTASATMGGTLAPGASSVVSFQVKVNTGVTGPVSNQGTIAAGGSKGSPVTQFPTDGNGAVAGAPPTVVTVNQCATNADCGPPTPVCDTAVQPPICVGCLVDSDCGGPTSGIVCNTFGNVDTCEPGCRGMGGNGCPTTQMCSSTTSTIGTCGPLATTSTTTSTTTTTTTTTTTGTGGAGGAPTTTTTTTGTGGAGGAGGSGGAKTTGTASAAGGAGGGQFVTVGNGIACTASSTPPRGSTSPREGAAWLLGAALTGLALRRRRR